MASVAHNFDQRHLEFTAYMHRASCFGIWRAPGAWCTRALGVPNEGDLVIAINGFINACWINAVGALASHIKENISRKL